MKTNISHLPLSASLLLSVLLYGCAAPDIVVTDQDGKPIKGAKVTVAFVDVPFTMTNAKGQAQLPGPAESITVSKVGYTEGESVDAKQPKPIRVELVQCSPRFNPVQRLQNLWTGSLAADPHFTRYKDALEKGILDGKNLHVRAVEGHVAYNWIIFRDNPDDVARWVWYGAPDDAKKHRCLVAVSGGLGGYSGWVCYFDMEGNLVLFHLMPEG